MTVNREEVKIETTLADLKFIPTRPFCLEMRPGSHTKKSEAWSGLEGKGQGCEQVIWKTGTYGPLCLAYHVYLNPTLKGGEANDARMDDEWLGIGLWILRLAHDDLFVLDSDRCRSRFGSPMVYQRREAERVVDGRDRFTHPEKALRQQRDRQGAVRNHEAGVDVAYYEARPDLCSKGTDRSRKSWLRRESHGISIMVYCWWTGRNSPDGYHRRLG